MKKLLKRKIDSVEKLAAIMLDSFADIDARFDALEHEMRSGFADIRRILDRIDTRLAALEMAVFGASSSTGRMSAHSILGRLAKLERAVFKK
jgi:membrane protein required for beta-lactamase induction